MRPLYIFASLFVFSMPCIGHAQIKPETSGATSFNEPRLRKHHTGLIFPNQPGKPRVGYHRHLRRPHHRPY